MIAITNRMLLSNIKEMPNNFTKVKSEKASKAREKLILHHKLHVLICP